MSGSEGLDFSGLFKLETLVQMEVVSSCFYEVGLQRLIALAGKDSLEFLHIGHAGYKTQKTYEWDFTLHPIRCMCFEPAGTWLLAITDRSIALIPFMPIFEPKSNYDHKWSLTDPTIILFLCHRPVSLAWWLTKEAENIAIIALRSGIILFYSLDSKTLLSQTKVPSEISDIQICVDDSLDLLVLLTTGTANQHWKLVLEHRSVNYNWIRVFSAATPEVKEKKDGLMAYLTEKITTFTQGASVDKDKLPTVECCRESEEYLPVTRKGSGNWNLTVQYVNGRHFITAFDVETGTILQLENTEAVNPSRTLHPRLRRGDEYRQALWCPKLLYLLTDNAVEVHSTSFSTVQDEAEGDSKDSTCLWRAELPARLQRGYLLSLRAANRTPPAWQVPTFLCDLQLPRFQLEQCLLVGRRGAMLLTTVSDPCEWLVGLIMRGGQGAERSAAALEAPVDTLLQASADMLLSRNKMPPAKYLYLLSKGSPEGWLARLGVFGLISELASQKCDSSGGCRGSRAPTVMKVLAQILVIATCPQADSVLDTHCQHLTSAQLAELCELSASVGLWQVLTMCSTHMGLPHLILTAINGRKTICKGALGYMLRQKYLQRFLLEVDASFLYRFLDENCSNFNSATLKRCCIWLSPLSEEFKPVLRDLKNGEANIYTTRLEQLIRTFVLLLCEWDLRRPSSNILRPSSNILRPSSNKLAQGTINTEQFVPKRTVSCGLMHWAIAQGGDAMIHHADTAIKTELIGRVLSVSCGRHHTLVLTENGVYSAGDNSHGQLGIGLRWAGPAGEAAGAGGSLLPVRGGWGERVTAVVAGQYHSAAIDTRGRLFTWGWGVHGQLGLGSTDDALLPKLVATLQGRKYQVVQVGCGACHTVALTLNGEVWAFGASMYGQLGSGNQVKSSVPVLVHTLPAPVTMIAVGYFHNLALTERGEVWRWGASPQAVRAAVPLAQRTAAPPPDEPLTAPHLTPSLVDTTAVRGTIVQISAGWHHSCLLSDLGYIYTWGLNFDGQLGRGDRKAIAQPQQVEIPAETTVDDVEAEDKPTGAIWNNPVDPNRTVAALIACGGDFTVYVDDYGKIYITGNVHQQNDNSKESNRVIMMKTTRRVIKIPAIRSKNRFVFQYIDKFDHLLSNTGNRPMIATELNPLTSMSDFNKETLIDEFLEILKPWINSSAVADNPNIAARLAYHNKQFAECLKLQLENITYVRMVREEKSEANVVRASKGNVTTTVKNRIKEIGMAYLNEMPFPQLTSNIYASLPCTCDEASFTNDEVRKSASELTKKEIAQKAAKIIDDSLSNAPANYESWNRYLSLARQFFLDNSLPGEELEEILKKYVEKNANLVTSAVMFSDECASYEKLFTPKFYLSMCSKIIDTSG